MEPMTISEVSAAFQVSARMLRYYEKMGLIQSARRKGYAYRVYDGSAVQKVQQIVMLRRLQIPLKQIRCMMEGGREEAVRILEEQLQEMKERASTVRTMETALKKLLDLLRDDTTGKGLAELIQDRSITSSIASLPLERHHLQEASRMSIDKEMDNRQGTGIEDGAHKKEVVDKESCIRIVHLPPCTVAAYQFTGDDPEETVHKVMDGFVRSSGLYEKKPDARMFGFNHPDPGPDSSFHGYEDWVTVPDDMEVPAPLVKKHFPGGLYAAYTISFPDFHEWGFLAGWADKDRQYQADYHDPSLQDMGGCLEEHLNWVYSSHMGWPEVGIDGKIDLLLPVRPR